MLPQVFRNKKSKVRMITLLYHLNRALLIALRTFTLRCLQLPIYFYPAETDEVMHGLVSRAMAAGTTGAITAEEVTSASVSAVPKVCPAALNFAKDQKKV